METSARIPSLVPVFPLPTVVLFPKALLPLKVFEPRYRAMVKDVLDSYGFIAMGLLKPGWEKDYFGSPDVFPVVGVGRILEYRSEPDGTYRIVLWGERRAEIREWVTGRPYRTARVEPVPEEEPAAAGEREALRERIRTELNCLISRDEEVGPEGRSKIEEAVQTADELGFLVDSIAFHFLSDPREKQVLLEARNAIVRERLLREFLVRHAQIAEDELSGMEEPDEGGGAGDSSAGSGTVRS